MEDFKKALIELLGIEGTYSNHPSDSGGKTMYGITLYLARKYNYHGAMESIPMSLVETIYLREFWMPLMLSEIKDISPAIVSELFDTGVNQGSARAAEYLQLCLNALNRQQKDYKDIKVDGFVGDKTLNALRFFIKKRGAKGELVLLRALNCLQGAHYIKLSQSRKKDEDFVFGWLLNRIVI